MNSSVKNVVAHSPQIWFFPGAQRVGTHFQLNTMMDALQQLGIPFVHHPGNDLDAYDLKKFPQKLAPLLELPVKFVLVNNHWRTPKERDFLLSYENALCFLIWRDFRDALVSYFHFLVKRRNCVFRDFKQYYWMEGYAFLWRQSIHYLTWHEIGEHPRVFHADFSRLATHFEEEAGRMLAFAGITGVDLHSLAEGVSIEKRRISDGDQQGDFYRKGKNGEYEEFVQDEEIRIHVERTLKWGQNSSPLLRTLFYKFLEWSCRRRA